MSIYIGSTPIKAMYVGNTPVKRVMLGATEICSNFNILNYSPLRWLESDPLTWFNANPGGANTAVNGLIRRWEDKSGNFNHISQAASTNERQSSVINGRDALKTTSSIYMDGTLQTACVIAVCTAQTGTASNESLIRDGTSQNVFRFSASDSRVGSTNISFASSKTGINVYAAWLTGSQARIKRNSETIISSSSLLTSISASRYINALFVGNVVEMAQWGPSQYPSESEINAIVLSLMQKYNIA
jgi:hypothetical protein